MSFVVLDIVNIYMGLYFNRSVLAWLVLICVKHDRNRSDVIIIRLYINQTIHLGRSKIL